MDKTKVAALAADFKAGNKQAFGTLYEEYIRPIYNFIYYKTHHKQTAEDLTSQTFIKAYSSIKSFDETRGPFSAWLYQIARNTVIDHYRVTKPTSNVDDIWDLGGNDDVERDLDVKLKAEKIQQYFKLFTSEQRDIVIMRIWQEMSYAEIAEVLGKSEDSCKMTFSRAIRKLRESVPEEILTMLLLFFPMIRNNW